MENLEAQACGSRVTRSHRQLMTTSGEPSTSGHAGATSGEPSTSAQGVAASEQPSTLSEPATEDRPEPFDVEIAGELMQLDSDLEVLPASDDDKDETWRPDGIEANSDAESSVFLSDSDGV